MEPARDADAGLVTEDETLVVEVALEATPDKRGGLFCNAAGVNADSDSVTIDFAAVDPGGTPQTAVLQARIRLSHRMAIRLYEALSDNITGWLPQELEARRLEQGALEGLLKRLDPEGADDA